MSETGRAGCGHLWRWERRAELEVRMEVAALQKALSSALAWPRVGGAGQAELARGVGGSHAVLRGCARGSFGALSALDLRARFAPLFHRLELNCSEHSWLC